MLYQSKSIVYSEIHTKHVNALYGQNIDLLNANLIGTESNHWDVKC
jgi:hypothetical protein